MSANDVVPALKPGIDGVPPPGTGEELVTVGPLELRAFELQLARMLDGKRTATEVIENARAVGLPLSLDALEDFLSRLQGAGLMTESQRPPRLGEAWQPAARELYRDALKSVRQGEFDDARTYLDSMLRIQPATREAEQLKRWIDTHPDPHVVGRTFGDVYLRTVAGWASERPAHLAAELRDSLRMTWWLPLGVLTAIGFLIFYAFLPVSHRVFTAAELMPTDALGVVAPAAGSVDEVLVKNGDAVQAGTPLAILDATELNAAKQELKERLEATRAPADGPGAVEAAAIVEELKRIDQELEQKTVRATHAGTVKHVLIEPGQAAVEGEPLVELEGRSRMRVEIQLPKKHADSVAVGTPVTVHIAGQAHHTRIDEVKGQQIYVEVANPEGAVEAGPAGVQVDLPPSSLMQRARH
ncbi:MAG: efflux RND transporter periplasmic adaptor subunit [Myxococcaceae bacterium]|nr:efflux RND transporter periplasmic adaptor subunit [Myxococcaceae bacterium]